VTSPYVILDGDVGRDRSAVLDLGKRNLPGFSPERFTTYYERHPYGPPLFQLALTPAGEPVGMAALFPAPVWIDGVVVDAAVAGDFSVDARHRAFGPALLLQRRLLERADDRGFQLAFGIPNSAAEPLLRRVGYRRVGAMDTFVKLLRIGSVVRRYARDPRAARLAAQLSAGALSALGRRRVRGRLPSLEAPAAFDSRFEGLLASVRTRARVVPERRIDVLNWKFRAGVGDRYAISAVPQGSGIAAYAVVLRNDRVHRIVDLVYDGPRSLEAVIGGVIRRADAEHSIAVTIQQLGKDATLRRVLQGHRFVVEADSVGLDVFVSPSAPPPSFVFEPEHWSLLPGDVDI
jgi:GNAT superfamily N-acetyltransferase